jgi:hypothetical protein
MKIYYRTLLIALAFSFAIGILSHVTTFLTRLYPYPNDYQAIATNSLYFSIIGMIISPVLLFVTFYYIGKKPETIGEFYSQLLSFFIGNLIGFALGNFLGTFLTVIEMPFEYVAYLFLFSFAGSPFSSSFFVGFSALAISYIIRKSKKPNDAQA